MDSITHELLIKVVNCLDVFLNSDTVIYERSNTNLVVAARLTKASSILRVILTHVWGNPKFISLYKPRQSERLVEMLLRHFTCEPIDEETQICQPTISNMSKSLNFLLAIQCFKDHMFSSTYELILDKSIMCLNIIFSDSYNSSKYETVTTNLLSLISHFLSPSNTSDLQILNNSHKDYYNKTFDLCLLYFKHFFSDTKREKESMILIFKIINKCLFALSTENVKLCYQFFKLGLQYLLDVKAITSLKFVTEIAIFINLIPSFINLAELEKLEGDNWKINFCGELINEKVPTRSSRIDRSESSIIFSGAMNPALQADESLILSDSQGSDDENISKKREHSEHLNLDSNLTEIGKLLEIVIGLLNDHMFRRQLELGNESVKYRSFSIPKREISLFNFKNLYFKNGNSPIPWLLRVGFSRLLISFYTLRPNVSSLQLTRIKRSHGEPFNYDYSFRLSEYVFHFDDPISFFVSIIVDDPYKGDYNSLVICQMFTLFLAYIQSADKLSEDCIIVKATKDDVDILSKLIDAFERNDHNVKFWLFYAAIVFHTFCYQFKSVKRMETKGMCESIAFEKLMKYSLEFLKDPLMSNLACTFLTNISIFYFTDTSTKISLKKSLLQQYQNVMELSEINGPSYINKESILFWITSSVICKNFNFTSAKLFNFSSEDEVNSFSYRVGNWLLSKLDSLGDSPFLDDAILVTDFVKWLLGETVLCLNPGVLSGNDFYQGDLYILFQAMRFHFKVCDSILHKNFTVSDEFSDSSSNFTAMKLSSGSSTSGKIRTLFSRFISLTFTKDDYSWVKWTLITTHSFSIDTMDTTMLSLNDWGNMLLDRVKDLKDHNELSVILHIYYDFMLLLPLETNADIVHIIPQSELLDLTVNLLNSGENPDKSKRVTDLFDSLVGSNFERYIPNFPDYHMYRSDKLTLTCSKLEQKAMLFFLRSHNSPGNISPETAICFSSKLKSRFQFLATQYELMKFFKNKSSNLTESLLDQLYNLLTMLLEAHETKMFESSLVVVTDLFERFSDTWIDSGTGIEADGKALYEFLQNIDSKNMLHTNNTAVAFFKLLIKLLLHSSQFNVGGKSELHNKVIELFGSFSNIQRYKIAAYVGDYIEANFTEQIEVYSSFVGSFNSPQQSIEKTAMFCSFMLAISQSSDSITIACICNLLQLSKFNKIYSYIKSAIAGITAKIGLKNTTTLFLNFKEVLLKCWMGFGIPITDFPYSLFGFNSVTQFYRKCYKEIIALALAYDNLNIVSLISKSISMKESSITNDSMALSISLSWTKGGIRNKVFKTLEIYYKSPKILKANFKEQFLLVIYNLLRFCDCSIKSDLTSIFECNREEVALLFATGSSKIAFLEEYDLCIKPKCCVDMLKYFSETCGLKDIWTPSLTYHLASKILLLIERSILKNEKLLHVRRLKLLLMLGINSLSDSSVCELVITNITPLLYISSLIDEVAPIINIILKRHSVIQPNLTINTCFVLLNTLLRLDKNPTTKQMATMLEMVVSKELFQDYYPVYIFALNSLTGQSIQIDIDMEVFINRAWLDPSETNVAVELLSSLFDTNIEFESLVAVKSNFIPSPDYIQNLYNIKRKPGLFLSNPMLLWIGRSLGAYYLQTGKCPKSQGYEFYTQMLINSNCGDFTREVKSLNSIFSSMISHAKSCTLKEKYCFETIVGVITYREKILLENSNSVISYDDLFLSMESHVEPIGNYLCSLLIEQVEDETPSYYKNTLDQVLNGFSALVQTSNFQDWMSQILFSLINELSSQTPIVILLATYICHIPKFSVDCFCQLILFYIENQPLKRVQYIAKMMHEFFMQDYTFVETEAIEVFVELVLLIRVGNRNANDKFISVLSNLDMLLVVDAALHIKKFKTALMLYEDYVSKSTDIVDDGCIYSSVDINRLKIIYSGLKDRDLISGLPTIPELEYGVQSLKSNSSWREMMFSNAIFDTCLRSRDTLSSPPIDDISRGMMNMGWIGASKIVSEFSRNIADRTSLDDDQLYEQLWKLNQWDIPSTGKPQTENQSIYFLLKNIKEDMSLDRTICDTITKNLVKLDTEKFGSQDKTSNEKLESWMRTLSICFSTEAIISPIVNTNLNAQNFSSSTEWFDNATCDEFENILLSRCTLLELIGNARSLHLDKNIIFDKKFYWSAMVSELHRYNSLMILKNQIQKSINASVRLNQISKDIFKAKDSRINRVAKFNLARSFWMERSDTRFPIETLKSIIYHDAGSLNNKQSLASNETIVPSFEISTNYLLATLSQWCEESKQETFGTLIDTYVSEIVESFNQQSGLTYEKDTGLTYHIIAKLCDDQITKTQDDPLLQKLSQSITLLEQDIVTLTNYVREDNIDNNKKKYAIQDLNRLKLRHKVQAKELTLLKKERKKYAVKAVNFYFKSIAFRNHNYIETDIDRFCSLWIEHNDIPLNESELLGLPTRDFVPWGNQLVSRLLDEKSTFQGLLRKLIINMTYSHPFHTLYLLKSLRIIRNESDDSAAISRGEVAEQIWKILANSVNKFNVEGFHNIVESVDVFADKSVEIANLKLKNTKKIPLLKLPNGTWWKNDLPQLGLPSPVKNIVVSENKPYRVSELPIMQRVSEIITTASSGVSHPKIMKFSLSTGESQKMLMKAPDDLRQDSIMKQVFEKVNGLLRQDIETRKRNLRIVTYNVLPLGPTSGILEFVPNSMPLVDILKSLHQNDSMDINEARMKMKEVQTQSKSVRYQTYKEICKKIKPCLKDFFFNNFTLPDTWFNSRTLYCHGIATTSITGYILGIGDRHCNNILLDKSSGEPIHIDFGIAFDQGKLLPIPETVPFRLTRDIVDGMGVTRVNGMFSKSCEHVIRVLRSNTQYIAGILDVLKYDPLYSWTLSPLRKRKLRQIYFNGDENNANLIEEFHKTDIGSEANNAIETVKKKLEAKGLSDEAIVRELIREAEDPKNLCLLFMGWSPFL